MKKRRLLLIISIILLLFTSLTVTVLAFRSNLSLKRNEEPYAVLVCGLDESGLNTDVMFVACAEPSESRFTVLQIPRDTLVLNEEGKSVKINSRFATFLSSGMRGREAAIALKKEVSALLGLPVSQVVIPSAQAVSTLVDLLGGVRVNVPRDISYSDPTEGNTVLLRAGEQILNGRQSLAFIRYRSGYARGDLGRMDAQKLFLRGVCERLRAGVGVSFAAKAAKALSKQSIYTDMNLLRGIESGYRMLSDCHGTLYLATLPGEAMYIDGTWFFVARREGADALLSERLSAFYTKGGFDPQKRLCNADNLGILNAYESPDRTYRIYSEGELSELSL